MRANADVRRIRALRLRAQGLVPGVRDWSSAADVAHGMLAMQAQDAAGVRWALALRAGTSPTDAEVIADLDGRRLARNRPSRGTLQVTAPEDMHWLSATLGPRALRAAEQRRPQLALDDATLAAAEGVVRAELADGAVRTRTELVAACAARGIPLDGPQAGHVLRHLTQAMVMVFARSEGRVDCFALADTWLTTRRSPARSEALAEVALRFVRARGPVTRNDLGRWADLPMGDVDAGLEAAADALETVRLDQVDYLVEAGTADIDDAAVDEALRRPLLLPAFDEYLLGYGTRGALITDEGFDLVVPGRNGVFRPMVVVDGEIVGTWRPRSSRTAVTVTIEPFGAMPTAGARRSLAACARAYGRFLDRTGTLAQSSRHDS